MNDEVPTQAEAEKRPRRRLRLSPVWLVPLGAVFIGCWLLYQNIATRGPEITLQLKTAEGLEKGKTAVKVLNVDVGTVRNVHLNKNYDGAIAEIRMQPDMEKLLVEDTKFWVVKPRVGRQGISGLGTIISGAYIQMRPGKSTKPAHTFTVLEKPPPTRTDAPGITLELISKGDDSVSVGDPVVYKGESVGQIETTDFDVTTQEVRYRIFVKSPYNKLINKNTKFWLRSGIDVQFTSRGVEAQIGNLQAILAGGVTFDTPKHAKPGPRAANNAMFALFPSRHKAEESQYDENLEYIVLFKDSVRNLNAGASVEFNGVQVGVVEEVPFFNKSINLETLKAYKTPVLIKYQPQRLLPAFKDDSPEEFRQRLNKLFDRGLRATIKTANLLTGAMFVDLKFDPKTKFTDPRKVGKYDVFPSAPGGFATLQDKFNKLLDKINGLPIKSLLTDLQSSLRSTDKTMDEAQKTLSSLNRILNDDAVQQLPSELQSTLHEVRNTLRSLQQGNPAYDNLNRSLQKLNRVLDDLQPLTQTLRKDPNALIFGKDQPADPTPKAAH